MESTSNTPNLSALFKLAGVFWCSGALGLALFNDTEIIGFSLVLWLSSIVVWNFAAIGLWECSRRRYDVGLQQLIENSKREA